VSGWRCGEGARQRASLTRFRRIYFTVLADSSSPAMIPHSLR
jgi:hypothetical protein